MGNAHAPYTHAVSLASLQSLVSDWCLRFHDGSVGKEYTCDARGPSSIPGSGRSAGEGIGYPLQYDWASLVAQLVKNLPAMQETLDLSWIGEIPWRVDRLSTPVFLGFPGCSAGKECACNVGDLGSLEKIL